MFSSAKIALQSSYDSLLFLCLFPESTTPIFCLFTNALRIPTTSSFSTLLSLLGAVPSLRKFKIVFFFGANQSQKRFACLLAT
jgi:hypothetical protein